MKFGDEKYCMLKRIKTEIPEILYMECPERIRAVEWAVEDAKED